MGIKTKQILAVVVGVIPFYAINIYSNVTGDIDYVPEVTLIKYPIFAALVLLIILGLNRFLLRNNLNPTNRPVIHGNRHIHRSHPNPLIPACLSNGYFNVEANYMPLGRIFDRNTN